MSIRNMFESIRSGDDEGGGSKKMTDGGLMMSDGSDDLGDLEDLASDEMGEFDDMDRSAGADADELEHRLNELENEVSSLSSTVSTVRTENEQISESVDDVQENVQKLLDIYEMVTRGVNPFTNDISAGMGGMDGDNSFGLFDEEDGSQQEEEIDDDIVNADAEGFFDDELTEDTGKEEPVSNENADDRFTHENSNDGLDDNGGIFEGGNLDDVGQDSGDGTTFQDLKNEYESGDAEWTAEEGPKDGAAARDATVNELDGSADNPGADELFTESKEDRDRSTSVNADTEPEPKSEPGPNSIAEETSESPSTSQSTARARKPYLDTLPSGYTDDLIVLEWIEYLIQQAGYRETTRAIEYYETIDWIAGDVADALQMRLRGFDGVNEGDRGLTIDHHTQSLEYISQLDDDGGAEAVMLSKLAGRGGQNGLQR